MIKTCFLNFEHLKIGKNFIKDEIYVRIECNIYKPSTLIFNTILKERSEKKKNYIVPFWIGKFLILQKVGIINCELFEIIEIINNIIYREKNKKSLSIVPFFMINIKYIYNFKRITGFMIIRYKKVLRYLEKLRKLKINNCIRNIFYSNFTLIKFKNLTLKEIHNIKRILNKAETIKI
ncbi:hypothetical protein (nucleomorph) [Guillardia theta]|uniref:GINS subunit domain-containing protein n=1 Tax=Guillardia theta TaxID=55529 RepID=Q9SEV4_GUITH|nr:hypothetical protein GTHECHR3136 [Guillardia theta]AAF24011.1 hypothetical protein [Guillardia theta]